jgi:CheY-like chemotaxis protein
MQPIALVVDDDKYNRDLNIQFLEKNGVLVEDSAVNGEQAVSIFRSRPAGFFDFIVMDLEMPVMNGKDAIAKIRKLEKKLNRLPVFIVIVTGNVDLREYNMCMDS